MAVRALAWHIAPAFLLLAASASCSYPPCLPARTAPPPPPAPVNVDHGSDFFDGRKGARLFEQWWRPKTQKARGVVVIVHGLKDHSSRYAELATRLVERGFAVYAIDLRGHAHSSGLRAGVDQFEDYLVDLDALIARARAHEPDEPLFVFGHGLGGTIATLWAIERKPKLGGLVLSSAALRWNVSLLDVAGVRIVGWFAPNAGVFQLDLAEVSRTSAVVRASASDPLIYQGAAPARTETELLSAIDVIHDRRASLRVPLLVMHGEADRITDPEGSRELVEEAISSDKTLFIWPRLAHDLIHEPEGAAVIDAVVSWIDDRAPRAIGDRTQPQQAATNE